MQEAEEFQKLKKSSRIEEAIKKISFKYRKKKTPISQKKIIYKILFIYTIEYIFYLLIQLLTYFIFPEIFDSWIIFIILICVYICLSIIIIILLRKKFSKKKKIGFFFFLKLLEFVIYCFLLIYCISIFGSVSFCLSYIILLNLLIIFFSVF